MTKNIGSFDRLLRLTIGVVLIVAAILYRSSTLAIFGLFTLYEAVSSWCVLYQLIGRNTCPLTTSPSKQKVPLFRYYSSGIAILLTAIILNILANFLGWFNWHNVLSSPNGLSQISLDNWFFLLFFYPLTLAFAGITVSSKK